MTRLIAITAILFAACGLPGVTPEQQLTLALPLTATDPVGNPETAAKVALGRSLFWDPILSGNRDIACATCHHPAFAYTDGIVVSVGVSGHGLGPNRVITPTDVHRTSRNSMTVLDSAFNGITATFSPGDPQRAPMFWDSRAASLEKQALGPMQALDEMRGPAFTETTILPEVINRLNAIPEYAAAFSAVYGPDSISAETLTASIAAFERTLVDHDNSFDRYVRGDTGALTPAAVRGFAAFNRSGCSACHSGPMFSDFQLHRLGVRPLAGAPNDVGNGAGLFRTGSLRNITRTAPYMHNGSLASLDDVFRFYDRIDKRQDPKLAGLNAPEGRDAADVKAFLSALSDGSFDRSVPATVPSGLHPGGAIP